MLLSIFNPKECASKAWTMIKVKQIIRRWETLNFGWAVVEMTTGENRIVCLG